MEDYYVEECAVTGDEEARGIVTKYYIEDCPDRTYIVIQQGDNKVRLVRIQCLQMQSKVQYFDQLMG